MQEKFSGSLAELKMRIGFAEVGRPRDNPREITAIKIIQMAKVKCAPSLVIYTMSRMCKSGRAKKQTKSAKIKAVILKLLERNMGR